MRMDCFSSARASLVCPRSSCASSLRASPWKRARPGPLLLPLVSALLCAPSAARGASLFDPALRFRVLPTEHFVIYFHQGAQPLAERLAPIAEETWRALQRPQIGRASCRE